VEAIATVAGAISTIAAGKIQASLLRNQKKVLLIITILSAVQGGLIIFAAKTNSLYVNYTLYIFYLIFFSFTICVSGAEIAKHLIDDCYGLVFGINTFVGISFQTILTAVVTSSSLALSVSAMYSIYGYLLIALAVIYLLGLVYEIFRVEHIPIED
jgi:thiamine transporter 2/3